MRKVNKLFFSLIILMTAVMSLALIPALASAVPDSDSLTSVAGKSASNGSNTGVDIANAIVWNISVDNSKSDLELSEIIVAGGGSFHLYSDTTFTTEVVAPAKLPLFEGGYTTAYIKTISLDMLTSKYYKVTIERPGLTDYKINGVASSWTVGIDTVYLNDSNDVLELISTPSTAKKIVINAVDGSVVTIKSNGTPLTKLSIEVSNDITLILDKVDITSPNNTPALFLHKNNTNYASVMTLNIVGNSKLTGTGFGSGILSQYDQRLVITGSGTLDLQGGDALAGGTDGGRGIEMNGMGGTPDNPVPGPGGMLTIQGAVTVNTRGGDSTTHSGGDGILMGYGDLYINNGAKVNAYSGDSTGSNYNRACGIAVSFLAGDPTKGGNLYIDNATVKAYGGTATLVSGGRGLYATISLNINNAVVEAYGGNGPAQNGETGIYLYDGNLTISQSTVTAKGGNGGVNGSHGIFNYIGNITIDQNSNVTAIGGDCTNKVANPAGLGGVGIRAFGYNGTAGVGKTVTIASGTGKIYVRGGQGAIEQRASIMAKEIYIGTGNIGKIVMESTNPRLIKHKASGVDLYQVKVSSDPAAILDYTANVVSGGDNYTYVSPNTAIETAYMWLPAGSRTITAAPYVPKVLTVPTNDTTETVLTMVEKLTLTSRTPTQNASSVQNHTNLQLVFSDPITVVAGKHIVIKRSVDDAVVESIDLSSAKVTVSDKTVNVTLSADLYSSTSYYVQIEASGFKDADNNFYAGISDKTSWTFATEMKTEVTANTSEELAYYLQLPAITKINLVSTKTYNYVGGTVTRNLTIDGHGAKLVAGLGFTENIIRSDGVIFTGLGNFNNEKTFLGVSGSQGYLKLMNLTIENGVNKNGSNNSADGLCAVINVKADGSFSMDKVTIKGFHNNPVPGNKNAFGVHSEPGAKLVNITNSTFDSSNAFRNTVAIRGGNFVINGNTFKGTDFPLRLRQDDGYEYAIYIFGGTGKVEMNNISGFVNTNQPGYTSAGISVTGFYPTVVSIEKNNVAQNVSGISVTAFWTGAGTNKAVTVNGISVISAGNDYETGNAFKNAFSIGELLGASNGKVPVAVMVDQNDEVAMGDGNFMVLGGYKSSSLSVKSFANNKLTVEFSNDLLGDLALASAKVFEMQMDHSGQWLEFGAVSYKSPSTVELTLVPGHKYKFRLKMTHSSTPDGGDPTTRTLYTYTNSVPELPKVTGVNATALINGATVTFTPLTSTSGIIIKSYKVIVFEEGVEKPDYMVTTTTSSATINGLSSAKSYYFKVIAMSDLVDGSPSDASNVLKPTPQPYTPYSGSTTGTTTSQVTTQTTGVDVLVNGKVENAGTAKTEVVSNRSTTTITVDQAKVEQKLAAEGNNAVVTIPVNTKSDVVVGELNGQMVKNMEAKSAVLEIKTDAASYSIPTEQINIASVAAQLGQNIALKDVKVRVEMAKAEPAAVRTMQSNAQKEGFTVVSDPISFVVTCSYGSSTTEIKQFDIFVERTIAIPSGVDPNKITTGIVGNPDGSVRHVPTKVKMIDGKYFAVINSLTNSPYSVIWNPMTFKDVEKHWAKTAINDMGSRMVVEGVDENNFNPNGNVTRAEFATIVVKALGLAPDKSGNSFKDVSSSKWYAGYITTATRYGIISGYNSTTFGPNDKITREQAMIMIAKAMKITGLHKDLSSEAIVSTLAAFSDGSQISNYAKVSTAACVSTNLVSGKEGKQLAPKAYMTRAEVAVIIRNLLMKSNLI